MEGYCLISEFGDVVSSDFISVNSEYNNPTQQWSGRIRCCRQVSSTFEADVKKRPPLHMYVRYYSNTVVAFRVRRLYVPGLIQLALKASIVGAATTVSPHYDRRGACSKENRGWHKTGTEGDRKYVFRWGKTHFGFRLWWHPSAGLAADLITATINRTRCGRAWKCRPEQRVSVRWLNDCYRWVYRAAVGAAEVMATSIRWVTTHVNVHPLKNYNDLYTLRTIQHDRRSRVNHVTAWSESQGWRAQTMWEVVVCDSFI